MSKDVKQLTIVGKDNSVENYTLIELLAPEWAETVRAGQFVTVHCPGVSFLRKPLSVHDRNRDKGTISLLIKRIGKGTDYIASREIGDKLDILGLLGNNFTLAGSSPVLIGGGVGSAPLKLLAREFIEQGITPRLLLGFSCPEELEIVNFFKDLSLKIKLACDLPSKHFLGNAVQLLNQELKNLPADALYACGPNVMLKNIPQFDAPLYFSLEEYMACGMGACLGCAVKSTKGENYHVCKDGPVFLASEVILND